MKSKSNLYYLIYALVMTICFITGEHLDIGINKFGLITIHSLLISYVLLTYFYLKNVPKNWRIILKKLLLFLFKSIGVFLFLNLLLATKLNINYSFTLPDFFMQIPIVVAATLVYLFWSSLLTIFVFVANMILKKDKKELVKLEDNLI